MLQHYFTLALRNFRRQAFFSMINVAGLAVGLAACWLIALFVLHEKSYDAFLPAADRICAVALDLKTGNEEGRTTNTPPPLGPRLAADFPEVELSARVFPVRGGVVVRRDWPGHAPLLFNESATIAADTAFLELFGFPMAAGSAASALDRPGSLVLTEAMAARYFGHESPMGQSLIVNDKPYTITGVVKDLPSTSSVQFDFVLPTADFKVVDRFSWSWVWLQVDTWVRLREKPDAGALAGLEAKFPPMVHQYAVPAFERIGQNFEENMARGDRYAVKLLPLPSLHLGSEGLNSRTATLGDAQQVRIFSIVGALILLLACVNFMNLSTARSMKRAREVGVRKALGSQRSVLVAQFLAEALLVSVAAMACAAVLATLALPFFNRLASLQMTVSDLFAPGLLAFVVVLPFVTGLLGGLYPAFYLSKFKAAESFKAAAGGAKGGHSGIRSGLVVFQFAVSIALMLCAFIVFKQLDYAQNRTTGLQRENVLLLKNARHLDHPSTRETFRQQVLQLPEVVSAAYTTDVPSLSSFNDSYEPEQGGQNHPVMSQLNIPSYMTDAGFVPTLGVEIAAGRNFLPDGGRLDSNSVILNETAVKAIGWDDPVGKWMRYPGNENQRFQVVGVMRDFHVASVRGPIEPLALFHESSQTYQTWGAYLALRLRAGTEKSAIQKASALWSAAVPDAPFEYDFLDASFARLYRQEAQTGSILGVFTVLALFIGCLGLFALAAFTAEQRTREIGIRKVLGASVAGITGLLARDFLKLVLLAILIASPVAYWVMHKWLADFAYRTEVQWWIFAAAGVSAIAVAFLTVGVQSVKAALANPIRSLRSE